MMRDSANANYIFKSKSAVAALAEADFVPQSGPRCSGSTTLGTRRTNQSVVRQLGFTEAQSWILQYAIREVRSLLPFLRTAVAP